MTTRPSFQFYPADWRGNSKLRRCSEAARGAWMDVLCLLHDSDEYGICRWPLSELAMAAGVSLKAVKELTQKDVLKGSDLDLADPYVYVPRSGRKDGDPVTLIAAQPGPLWYCSRMVKDEWVNNRRGIGSRFTTDNQPSILSPIRSPNRRDGERQGDGPSSSSSSSSSKEEKEPYGSMSEASSDAGDLREAVDAYNATAKAIGLPQCQKLSPRRKAALKARLRDAGGIAGWATALEMLADSPYCRGEVNGWRADIDFMLQEKSFTKLMEGSYAKRSGTNGRGSVHRENSIADGLEAARVVIDEQRRREREGS